MTAAQARGMAVLRWNRIANGATAFINGQQIGENEPTGPFQVIVPPGVLRPADNQMVLKIRGAASVRRSKSGNALIPAGFGVGLPEVTGRRQKLNGKSLWLRGSNLVFEWNWGDTIPT